MPVQITCPSCRKPLRVPEDLFGQRVQCPECQTKFIAEMDRETPAEVADQPRNEPGGRRRPRTDDDDYAERPRRSVEPHRGTLILILGILSIPICNLLGPFAWIMGNNDLAAMRQGRMDRSGEGTTQAGRICGIIGTAVLVLSCLYGVFVGVLAGRGGFRP